MIYSKGCDSGDNPGQCHSCMLSTSEGCPALETLFDFVEDMTKMWDSSQSITRVSADSPPQCAEFHRLLSRRARKGLEA
jgi:hypothetical protein